MAIFEIFENITFENFPLYGTYLFHIQFYRADGIELGTGFIASLTMPAGLITVLVTNHHVIHNLNEALDATYQFSYIRSDSVDTPDPISGTDLIPANDEGFSTCMEIDKVSKILYCSRVFRLYFVTKIMMGQGLQDNTKF